MTGSVLPVACSPACCLFGECCSAVKCWPSWQRFHCPFVRCLGLVRPTPGRHTGIQEGSRERGGGVGVGQRRGEELLAKHPSARPGPLPSREKTSRTHLCGDRGLSLHLKAKQHPIVICLDNYVHRTALKTCKCILSPSLTVPYCCQQFLWLITHSWI